METSQTKEMKELRKKNKQIKQNERSNLIEFSGTVILLLDIIYNFTMEPDEKLLLDDPWVCPNDRELGLRAKLVLKMLQ